MLITSEIPIKINHRVKKYYQALGYDITQVEIKVKVEDLPKKSSIKVLCSCDDCGKEILKTYQSYNEGMQKNKKIICKKCILKYRENPFSKKEIKDKIKKTLLEKYGVDNPLKNTEIKKKQNNTMIEKYGSSYPLYNEELKEKAKNKVLNRSQVEKEEIVEKWKNSMDFQKSRINFENSMLAKYGVKNALQHEEIKNKMLVKCKQRTPEYQQEINEKTKKTTLAKYGVNYSIQNPEIKKKSANTKRLNAISDFVEKYKNNNLIEIDYDNETIKAYCEKHGNFQISISAFYHRKRLSSEMCTECNKLGSYTGLEKEILQFIKNNYEQEIEENKRTILNNELELDIYLPKLKLAFEFNGLYWHSELNKDMNYHLKKTEVCEKIGIHLIHIYEDDWLFKQEIVKSRILNLLGKSEKIYARKCEVKKIEDNNLIRKFLEENHIQGYIGSKYKYGLYYKNELVSLMIFGVPRISMNQKDNKQIELLRFCNKTGLNIIGGASKLFKHFMSEHRPKSVLSYADRSWSQGSVYLKLGFSLVSITKPNYYYIIERERKYRFNYAKYKLVKQGFDSNKTEHEIMLDRKIYRIYDSGSLKFIWTNNNLS